MPNHYAGSDTESIASVLNAGFLLFPVILFIFLLQKLVEQDFDLSVLIGICLIFTLYLRNQFLKGQLRKSVIISIVFFNVALTIVCSMGNGINDIAIIGYPIIIGFSGIILDQKKLTIASILSAISITWLVFGKQFGLFKPSPILTGDVGDLIVTSLLIILGGVVAFSLTSNMKQSIKDVQKEILASKDDALQLSKETNEKLEIIEEIHRTVINSLHQIQQLIAHKQSKQNTLTPAYESLKRRVLVIEAAHSILLSEQAPIMLDLRELTSRLLNDYEQYLKISILHIDIGNTAHLVPLDLAINYGICLIELLNKADSNDNDRIDVTLTLDNESLDLKLSGFQLNQEPTIDLVIDLLAKQLKGTLTFSPTVFELAFKHPAKK